MRTPLVTMFYETLGVCFNSALTDILNSGVRDSIYDLLSKKGISREEVPNRFDDVVEMLTNSIGSCFRVVIYRTLLEMYREYSKSIDFVYEDSLRDRLRLLKELVVFNHLVPRRLQLAPSAELFSEWDRADELKGTVASTSGDSLYHLKRGVRKS